MRHDLTLRSLCSRLAGHVAVTCASVGVVIILLITATAMQWTTTAQLLCNTPTMIIEVRNHLQGINLYRKVPTAICQSALVGMSHKASVLLT